MNTGDANASSGNRDLTGLQPGKSGETEQHAADDLHESGRKFPALFDKAGFAAALSKPSNGMLVDVNEVWEQLFGYTRQEAIGKTSLEMNINVDADGRARILAQLQERGFARDIEMTLRTKSGEWRSFLTNISMVEIDGRSYILNTIQDITERKRAEEALRASEERYRVVIDNASDAIIVTDPSAGGRVLSANPAACRMFGYSPEEFEGLSRESIIDTSDAHLATVLEQRAHRGQASAELTYTRKDGTRFSGELSSALYLDKNGETRAVAIIRDITERKRTEEQLERSNQKLNEIVSSIQDDFYVLNRDWIFVYANRQFTSKIGKEPEDFVGNNIWKMFPKHVGTIFEENLRAAMEQREMRRFEIPGKYTNAWYSMTAFPSAEGITVLGTDITESKRAEDVLHENQKELQLLNETLEQKVHEKTAEVHQLASDLIKAVQHERHRISHILHDDLQQRIYAIQMQLTFLHDEFQGEEETVRKEVSDIERQLADILEVTRHLSIDLSPPILRDEGLAHAISWLTAQMRQRYGLHIELQATGSFAVSDEALHVLLFNCVRELLFNVVKHAQASRAVVALQWANAGLRIEVHDDGRGFSVSAPEPQANGEMSGENGSRQSLGLSTIRHQLSLFDGRMEIQSEPGAGTRVTLIIPAVKGR